MFRALGRIVGRALAGIGIKVFRGDVKEKLPVPPPPPAIPPTAVVVILAAMMTFGCAILQEFGIGVAEGVSDCLSNPELCAPRPTPTSSPTPLPTATATPEPTPTPTATATPTIPPQPRDFRLNFVNGCDRLVGKRRNGNETCGECDSTYRFIGTLSNGQVYGNACDEGHYRCAYEPCPDQTPEAIQAHIGTCELCGCRSWDSPMGSLVRIVAGSGLVTQTSANPYKHEVCGPTGTRVTIKTCFPAGAKTHDGLTIPVSGEACGPVKEMEY